MPKSSDIFPGTVKVDMCQKNVVFLLFGKDDSDFQTYFQNIEKRNQKGTKILDFPDIQTKANNDWNFLLSSSVSFNYRKPIFFRVNPLCSLLAALSMKTARLSIINLIIVWFDITVKENQN